MPKYYTDRAIAIWSKYENSTTPVQCPEDGHFYRLWARKQTATRALRGDLGLTVCCTECEPCSCFCNSANVWDESVGRRDASFNSEYDEGVATYSPITVSFSGIAMCDDPEDEPPAEDCWDDLNDNWGTININSQFSLDFIGEASGVCSWQYTEVFDFAICPSLCSSTPMATLVVTAEISATGTWTVTAILYSGICLDTTLFSYSSNNFDCSDGTVTIDSDNGDCPDPPARNSIDTSNASATVSWGTDNLVTPDHWTATFTGSIIPCKQAQPHDASVCPLDGIVEAAILQLKDPSGVVLYNTRGGARCSWASPRFQVRGHPTWYWVVVLVLSDDGAETTWKVSVAITYLGHKHDEGDKGGIAGLRYNCMEDRHEHWFFSGENNTDVGECDSPPAITNDLDCDILNGHVCTELGDGHDDCTPCGSGGSVALVGG